MIVAKFGGTSLADAACMARVAALIRQDPERRFVVVSAPGKRDPADTKITDMLLQFQKTGDIADFAPIEARFLEIMQELGVTLDLTDDFAEMKTLPHNADYIASCGEYLSARIMAAYLGWAFVDTETCVFFHENGHLDYEKTKRMVYEKLKDLPCAVLPGYYGVLPDGEIRTFSRGGSDISGALVADAMGADVYENWTDVDGMRVTDPRIIPEAAPLAEVTFDELRELAYRGASVLHEDSVVPVRRSGIPIHICNTFHPEAPGSWIVPVRKTPPAPITGIAGKKGFSTIQVIREESIHAVGFIRKILSCLEKQHISVTQMATGMGSVSLVVTTESIAGCREALKQSITEAVNPNSIRIIDDLAIVAVVGDGMIDRPEIRERLFHALAAQKIGIRIIDQSCIEMSILIGVDEDRFTDAITAVYREFLG